MKDIQHITLRLPERFFLFKKRFQEKFFLPDRYYKLYKWRLVKENYIVQDGIETGIPDDTFSLTDKYWRYVAYRRDRFFFGSVWPAIVSGFVAIVVSVFTSLLTAKLSGSLP